MHSLRWHGNRARVTDDEEALRPELIEVVVSYTVRYHGVETQAEFKLEGEPEDSGQGKAIKTFATTSVPDENGNWSGAKVHIEVTIL